MYANEDTSITPANKDFLVLLQKILVYLFAIVIPWQFFFTFYGRIDLSLAFFIACAGLSSVLFLRIDWREAFKKMAWVVSGYSLFLASIGISSLLHSPDNLYEAANVIGHLSVGLLVILWMGLLLNSNRIFFKTKDNIIDIYLLSALPLGIAGIIFFINPELENKWLNLISGILIEGDSSNSLNNISALHRVGVIFMDVNSAAIFWGISMWLALWRRQKSKGIWRIAYVVPAIIFFIDILATRSRGGIAALLLTFIVSTIIQSDYLRKNHRRSLFTGTFIYSIVLLAVASPMIFMGHAALKGKTYDTVRYINTLVFQARTGSDIKRLQLLESSVNAIKRKPLSGHGVTDFKKLMGREDGYPPHNMYLQTWIYGGLPAIFGLLILFSTVLCGFFRQLKNNHDAWLPILVILWVVIQAMFLNLVICNFRISMLSWLIVSLFLWSPNKFVDENR